MPFGAGLVMPAPILTVLEEVMKAKITNKNGYECFPGGFKLKRFEFGEIVTGQVAEWALADKAAKRMLEKKAKGAAPENKAV